MKTLATTAFALAAMMLYSCSVGVKKDMSSGLSVSYNGFSIGRSYLVGPDNSAITSNEVNMNTTVGIVIQGIENYVLKDGKAFPGLSLNVMDSEGKAVLDEGDLLNSADGYSPTDAAILRGTVTIGNPMRSGETYDVKMRIWDKNKPENEIVAEVQLVVK
jgi:hypothetical protein